MGGGGRRRRVRLPAGVLVAGHVADATHRRVHLPPAVVPGAAQPRGLPGAGGQPEPVALPGEPRDRLGDHRCAERPGLGLHGLLVLEVPLSRPPLADVPGALLADVPAGAAAGHALCGVQCLRAAEHLPGPGALVHDLHAAAVRVDAQGILRHHPGRAHRGRRHRRRVRHPYPALDHPAPRRPRTGRRRAVRLRPRLARLHLRPHPRRTREADPATRPGQHLHRRGRHGLAGADGGLAGRLAPGGHRLHRPAALPRRRDERRSRQGVITNFPSHHPPSPGGKVSAQPNAALSRRHLLQLLGLGAGATSLAACAPSASEDTPSAAGEATTDGSPEDFTFAAWSLTEEAPKPVIEAILEEFGSDRGITIDPISYPFNEYLNQLTLQIRGGEFSGAAQVDVAWLGSLASLGKLQDLSGLAEGRGYTDAALSACQYEGTQYGLPWTIGAIGMIGNSELLEAAGITELPTTIEDVESALTEIKATGVVPYAASTKVAQLKDIFTWMETFGCTLLDGDTVTIGDDASIEAVTWYKRLYDEGLIAADVDRFDARSLFAQGQAALYDDAVVGRSAVVGDSPDQNLADKMVPFSRPVLADGDTPRGWFGGTLSWSPRGRVPAPPPSSLSG